MSKANCNSSEPSVMIELHNKYFKYIWENYPELIKGITFEGFYHLSTRYYRMLSGDKKLISKIIEIVNEIEENN